MVDRVILTGFMASGKTSVGRALADRLEWDFLDFDEEIERREGRSIADIFRDPGEPHFRAWEARLTDEVADRRGIVLAPGGGWVTQPALVQRLRPGSLIVWLRVQPETVRARLDVAPAAVRPLLAGRDPARAIRELPAAIEAKLRGPEGRPIDGRARGANNSAARG